MKRRNEPARLGKQSEPMMVDARIMILMSFIFFIVLAIVGFAFRHYPSIQGVI